MYRTIVVGCDGSDHGLAAARFAAWLAGRVNARLIVAAAYAHTAHVRTDVGAEEGEERADAEAWRSTTELDRALRNQIQHERHNS